MNKHTIKSPSQHIKSIPVLDPSQDKIKKLEWYVNHGWPLFPCGPDKKPLTKNGFKDASLDLEKISAWHKEYPGANWGMPTGPTTDGGAGLVVIDIDAPTHKSKADGFATWDILRDQHSDPIQTITVKTGGGGRQLYFNYPVGHLVKSGTNVLGAGIDVRGRGGYVIVPPSITDAPYTFELSPTETELSDLPMWILSRVNGTKEPTTNQAQQQPADQIAAVVGDEVDSKNYVIATSALNALKQDRAEDYQQWLHVGMSLFALGDMGLIAWDTWSKQSTKYVKGACAQKWKTFNNELTAANKITFASLIHWAEEDKAAPFIRQARKGASPEDYAKVMEAMGFNFTLNDMNDMVYFNGAPTNDISGAVIEYQLRNFNYKSEKDTKITIYKTAHDKKFHPIKDYLTGLVLEAKYNEANGTMEPVDHIGRLCSFFEDRDGTFKTIFTKWLIGAVGRVLDDKHPGQQHPMFVLDGPQGIGKSRFAWWLGSPLPAFYIQSSINTEDKDFLINLCSKFVWEVEELGATLRKSDIESLKAFLSKEIVNVRKPYGHDAITKPATASFIGTINNSGGFLADPTGSRRFRVCTLTAIDWDYEISIDVNQIWAQAVYLYERGERWTLGAEDEQKMREINSRYDVDDPMQFDLVDTFNINPLETTKTTATAQIIHKLRTDGKLIGGNDNQHAQRISNVLTKIGCERKTIRVNGQQIKGWVGVWPR